MVARALRLRERLAVRIRAGETAEIAAFAKPLAGDEKASPICCRPSGSTMARFHLQAHWRGRVAALRSFDRTRIKPMRQATHSLPKVLEALFQIC
jgi:hypothetical protein